MARDADDATPISSRRELVEWLEAGAKGSAARLKIGTEHEKIGQAPNAQPSPLSDLQCPLHRFTRQESRRMTSEVKESDELAEIP